VRGKKFQRQRQAAKKTKRKKVIKYTKMRPENGFFSAKTKIGKKCSLLLDFYGLLTYNTVCILRLKHNP